MPWSLKLEKIINAMSKVRQCVPSNIPQNPFSWRVYLVQMTYLRCGNTLSLQHLQCPITNAKIIPLHRCSTALVTCNSGFVQLQLLSRLLVQHARVNRKPHVAYAFLKSQLIIYELLMYTLHTIQEMLLSSWTDNFLGRTPIWPKTT